MSGHELDRKDVGRMARRDCGRQAEGRDRILSLVGVDVEVLVIAARCQEATRGRPAVI